MSRKDIELRFDDIVAFAELEQFIDEQVKHYSSGMYVRLGFAVAINVEPDVLLVDEVLSVGDEAFQQKCLERVRGFQRDGRTIIFVSHAADLVRRICDRVMVLDHGRPITIDDPASAILVFRERLLGEHLAERPRPQPRPPDHAHRAHRGGRDHLARLRRPAVAVARRAGDGCRPLRVRRANDRRRVRPGRAGHRRHHRVRLQLRRPRSAHRRHRGHGVGDLRDPRLQPRRRHLPHRRRRPHPRRRHRVRLRGRSRQVTVVGGTGVVGIADLAAKVTPGHPGA